MCLCDASRLPRYRLNSYGKFSLFPPPPYPLVNCCSLTFLCTSRKVIAFLYSIASLLGTIRASHSIRFSCTHIAHILLFIIYIGAGVSDANAISARVLAIYIEQSRAIHLRVGLMLAAKNWMNRRTSFSQICISVQFPLRSFVLYSQLVG